MQTLATTPMQIDEPVYWNYNFSKITMEAAKAATVNYYVIDRLGKVYFKDSFDIQCPSPLKLGHYFGMERGFVMARKRHSDEDILKLLREIEVKLSAGSNVQSACRGVGISDATYYNWRKRFGGMGRSQLSEMRSLEKENTRLKKIVAELELDKLILKESLTYLKPRA